jgi:hypothetical protein
MIESLIISLAALVVILAFLMYHSGAPAILKLTVFPALIAAIILGTVVYKDRLGAPINAYPKGEFLYVFHQSGQSGEVIYLWVWTADRGQRLHTFDYDRQTMEELEEAKGRAEDGQEYGQFTANTESGFDYEQADEPHEPREGFEK